MPRYAIPLPGSLVAAEIEQLVVFECAADRASELVLLENLFLRSAVGVVAIVEEVVRVEGFIAEELEQRSVQSIGAGFGHNVHVGAGVAAEAGIVSGGLDLEFLNSVGVGSGDSRIEARVARIVIAGGVVDLDAVHLVVILFRCGAVDAHVLRAASEAGAVGDIAGNAGGQAQNLGEVSGGQGQSGDAASGDRGTQSGGCGLDSFHVGFHGHLLGLRAHLQGVIERRGFGDGESDRGHFAGFEALRGEGDAVGAGVEEGNGIDAIGARIDGAAAVGSGVDGGDGDVGNYGAGGIFHGAG